ncbi:MAG: leucyl aminopeptidase [Longimicrobiales bacterium]
MAELDLRIEPGADDLASPFVIVPLGVGASPGRLDGAANGVIEDALKRGDFRGRKDETLLLYPGPGSRVERLVLVGTGEAKEASLERLRRAIGCGVRQAERIGASRVSVFLDGLIPMSGGAGAERVAAAIAEALVLAAWDFRDLKTVKDKEDRGPVTAATIHFEDERIGEKARKGVTYGQIAGRAGNYARALAIQPGNVVTPTYLAERAREIAERFDMKLTVLDRAAIEREGMKALLAVAQGTDEEPRFITLEYTGASTGEAPLVLIGKGVTFDSGGISLKPADRMEEMKYDMSGAAATLAAMHAIGELKLAANVIGIIPSTENLPSGRAVKPGDVIGSHLGKTIEVINTDAEGRLILADALSWAQRFKPAAVLDAATLTGAVVVALGQHAIGLMGNNDSLIEEIRAVGERVGTRCWPLPLWSEYREQIDSPVADIKNSAGRPAGTITAGWFLREFAGDSPWAHLDVAGTAWKDEAAPYLRKGPTGVPTRIFIEWVRSRAHG